MQRSSISLQLGKRPAACSSKRFTFTYPNRLLHTRCPSNRPLVSSVTVPFRHFRSPGKCKTSAAVGLDQQNVYLKPLASNFQAVDSILLTPTYCSLLQISLGGIHSHLLGAICAALERLNTVTRGRLTRVRVRYCLIGTQADRSRDLVRDAQIKLEGCLSGPQRLAEAVADDKLLSNESRRVWLGRLEIVGMVYSLSDGSFSEA